MIWLYTIAFLFAVGGGIGIGIVWDAQALVTMRLTHKREMDEVFEEVRRLRAQNAMLIGKE